MPPSPKALLSRALLLLVPVLLGTCGEGHKLITVHLRGVPDSTQVLRLTPLLNNGQARGFREDFTNLSEPVFLALPASASGELRLLAETLEQDQCADAQGTASLLLDERDAYDLDLILTPNRPSLCPLTVTFSGQGAASVLSDPTGLRCGDACTGRFPRGTDVRLLLRPASFSMLDHWEDPCDGMITCQVQVSRPTAAHAVLTPRPQTCDGPLCWENPLPRALFAVAMWGASSLDIWAVASDGVMRFDGRAWREINPGMSISPRAIWGRNTDDVWILDSSGALFRFDGTAWQKKSNLGITATDISGGPDGIWVVGQKDGKGVSLHGNAAGESWEEVALPSPPTPKFLQRVVQTEAKSVYAIGSAVDPMTMKTMAVIYAYRGGAWQIAYQDVGSLNALWASESPNLRVWAAGTLGDSQTSTLLTSSNGKDWSRNTDLGMISLLAGPGTTEVWATGPSGRLWHAQDGASFRRVEAPINNISAIWPVGPSELWVSDASQFAHFAADTWTTPNSITMNSLAGLWGRGASDVWAVGSGGTILRRGQHGWTLVPSGTSKDLNAIWGSPTGDLWAVGQGGIILRRGQDRWQQEGADPDARHLYAVWGSASDDVWAVGDRTILRFDGDRWSQEMPDAPYLRGVWTSPHGDVWAVGGDSPNLGRSVILRREGGRFMQVAAPESSRGSLSKIWGSGPDDVWAAGGDRGLLRGLLLHWDGKQWTEVRDFKGWAPAALWGTGPQDVWLADAYDGLFHYDGRAWQRTRALPLRARVHALWGAPAGPLFLAGEHGALLRLSP